MKRVVGLIWLIVFLAGCANLAGPSGGLHLIIHPDQAIYHLDEAIHIYVILENDSSRDIIVNSRMALNDISFGFPLGEIGFKVFGPDNNERVFQTLLDNRLIKDQDYIELHTLDVIIRRYRIDFFFKFNRIGIYTITGYYENQWDPEDGRKAWKGEITSNEIEIEIAP